MNRVVVGVDESPAAAAALRWACSYGRLRHQPVRALMAWTYIEQHHADDTPFGARYDPEIAAQELHNLVDRALGPNNEVECEPVLGHPPAALVAASEEAELVVVGSRGLGGFRGLLLGSVARVVVHHAACPVAVVHGDEIDGDGPVVAGVDGSGASLRALEWAASYAADAGRRLVVVHAWREPPVGPVFYPLVADRAAAEQRATTLLQRAVDTVSRWSVDTDARSIPGAPAAELLATATTEHASMLVVGARGVSGFAGNMLGSVSDQVVHHADAPVVIVP